MNTKYLSASKLGITPEERTALLKVKRFLKIIPAVKDYNSRSDHQLDEVEKPAASRFNMNREVAAYDCGTACCIGGWMYLQMKGVPLKETVQVPLAIAKGARRYVDDRGPMGRLFYPEKVDYDSITPQRAAKEIERFLTTGKVTW